MRGSDVGKPQVFFNLMFLAAQSGAEPKKIEGAIERVRNAREGHCHKQGQMAVILRERSDC